MHYLLNSLYIFGLYIMILYFKVKLSAKKNLETSSYLYEHPMFWVVLVALWGLSLVANIKIRQTNYFIQKTEERARQRLPNCDK